MEKTKNIAAMAAKALKQYGSISKVKENKTDLATKNHLTEAEWRQLIAATKAARLSLISEEATTAQACINYDTILNAAFALVAKDKSFKQLCVLAAQKYASALEFVKAYYPFFDEEASAPLRAVKYCSMKEEAVYTRLEPLQKTAAAALNVVRKSLTMFADDLKNGVCKDAGAAKFAAWSWKNKYAAMQVIEARSASIDLEAGTITIEPEPAPMPEALPEGIMSLFEARRYLQERLQVEK